MHDDVQKMIDGLREGHTVQASIFLEFDGDRWTMWAAWHVMHGVDTIEWINSTATAVVDPFNDDSLLDSYAGVARAVERRLRSGATSPPPLF